MRESGAYQRLYYFLRMYNLGLDFPMGEVFSPDAELARLVALVFVDADDSLLVEDRLRSLSFRPLGHLSVDIKRVESMYHLDFEFRIDVNFSAMSHQLLEQRDDRVSSSGFDALVEIEVDGTWIIQLKEKLCSDRQVVLLELQYPKKVLP